MTNQARVRGYLVPVASQVSGEIIEAAVGMNEIVEYGQTIVRINPKDFELAVQKAELVLDVAPGKIFNGVVSSIGFGVNWNQGSTHPGDLPIIQKSTGCMGEPQRFPVIIQFSDAESVRFRREGGQANVIVYTGDNTFLTFLASLTLSFLSLKNTLLWPLKVV